LYGVTKTREIYERAIEALGDEQAKTMCLAFADLERKLGEVSDSVLHTETVDGRPSHQGHPHHHHPATHV
jgi:hypothetical protein